MSKTELKLEHHAVLNTDDLEELSELFNKNATTLVIDLRGRTTLSKSKSRVSDLGLKKLSHTYLEVNKDNLEFHNKNQIKKIISDYQKEGVNNLYVVRLLVTWDTGDMQEWHRAIIHSEIESNRGFPSGRFNTLVLKINETNSYQKIVELQEKYGKLVLSTACINTPIVDEKKKKRTCLMILKALEELKAEGQ